MTSHPPQPIGRINGLHDLKTSQLLKLEAPKRSQGCKGAAQQYYGSSHGKFRQHWSPPPPLYYWPVEPFFYYYL